MSTVNALKQTVKELKATINPDPKHLIFNFGFSDDKQPHGILNGQLLHWIIEKHGQETKWFEAIDTETDLASNRAYYENMISKPTNKFMKEPGHPFHSWESFLEVNRCKCGKHGLRNDQPFLGDVS